MRPADGRLPPRLAVAVRWKLTASRCSIRVQGPCGLKCGTHAETGRGLPPQGNQVAVHAIDGRAPSGRTTHGTDLAPGHDAPLEKRLDILHGHIDPDHDDFLRQGYVGKRAIGGPRG